MVAILDLFKYDWNKFRTYLSISDKFAYRK